MPSKDEVSDSTDWLGTALPLLAPVETALRCQVCKDFYDTPMITSCAHTFCSLCIRRCLSSDGKCPACRADDQALRLRRNWAVEELVGTFRAARPGTLDIARNQITQQEGGKAGRRALKRKLNDTDIEEQTEERPSQRQTRSRTQRASSSQQQEVVVLDSEDDGEDEDDNYQPDDGLVPCPICKTRMKEDAVFLHLDRCDGQKTETKPPRAVRRSVILSVESSRKLTHSSAPKFPNENTRTKPQSNDREKKRLPQLNYSLLRDSALKKKLQELGIPAWGSKQLMMRRHIEWVNLYNSNCDSSFPRSNRDLLKDLDTWEHTQGGHSSNGGMPVNGGKGVMRKDFDGQGWAQQNKGQFAELIANARRKPASSPKVTEPEEGESVSHPLKSDVDITEEPHAAPLQDHPVNGNEESPGTTKVGETGAEVSSIRPEEDHKEAVPPTDPDHAQTEIDTGTGRDHDAPSAQQDASQLLPTPKKKAPMFQMSDGNAADVLG